MASTRNGRRRGPRKGALKRQRAAGRKQQGASPRRSSLADYILGDTLREGLAGPVRAAVHRPTGAEVAVEEVPDHLRSQPAFVTALAGAGRTASALRHPRVASVYDVASGRRKLHVVGELVRGTRLIDAAEPVEPHVVIDSLLEGLEAVHAHGLAHGSVSPECLILEPDGSVRLAELGISEAMCAVEGRDCSPAADLATAAALGLGLLRRAPRRQRRGEDHRRATRALRRVAASRGAHATLGTAAAIRAAIAPQAGEGAAGSRRPRRGLRRLGLALAPVIVGVAAGLTVATATGGQPVAPPLALTAAPHLASYPTSGGCGATFVFTATGGVRGAGTLTYQWLRSDGTAGPVRHVAVGRYDASFRVTNAWTLTSRAAGPITMTLRVISPSHLSLSRSITAACT